MEVTDVVIGITFFIALLAFLFSIGSDSSACMADGTNCPAGTSYNFQQPLYNTSMNASFNNTFPQVLTVASTVGGTAVLTGAVTTILSTQVKANSLIFLTPNNFVNAGQVSVGVRNIGANFTVNSLNVLDASNYSYLIVNLG